MLWKPTRRSAGVAGLAMAVALVCTSCGGGSGDPGTGTGGGGGGGTSGPTGTLWFYDIPGRQSYSAPVNASQAPTVLTSDSEPVPWPDGSQYIEYDLTGTGTDLVRVKQTSSGSELYRVNMPNFSGGYAQRPSPVSKTQFLTQYNEGLDDENGSLRVVDLATGQTIYNEPNDPVRYKHRWLPDGRYLRVDRTTGEISTASVGGAWQRTGQMSVPAGRKVQNLEVNPQGTRLAMVFMEDTDDPVADADVWVSNLDGSQTEQVTATNASYTVFWSPDGRYLAFDHDTASCSGWQACGGTLSWWYAPETARNVQVAPNVANAQATQFQRRYASGNTTTLTGVSIRAWLP